MNSFVESANALMLTEAASHLRTRFHLELRVCWKDSVGMAKSKSVRGFILKNAETLCDPRCLTKAVKINKG